MIKRILSGVPLLILLLCTSLTLAQSVGAAVPLDAGRIQPAEAARLRCRAVRARPYGTFARASSNRKLNLWNSS